MTVLVLSYLFYAVFDNWTYTRFLLPAIPLMLVLSVWTVSALVRRLGTPSADVLVAIGLAFIALTWVKEVRTREVLGTKHSESRYIDAARYVDLMAPKDGLVLAMQHSGSIRYYAGRTTVRYDWLDQHGLDEAIVLMHRMNRGPLLVLDDWEEPNFRRRFQGQKWGALDWPARAESETQPLVRIYDPFDRDKKQSLHTTRIASSR